MPRPTIKTIKKLLIPLLILLTQPHHTHTQDLTILAQHMARPLTHIPTAILLLIARHASAGFYKVYPYNISTPNNYQQQTLIIVTEKINHPDNLSPYLTPINEKIHYNPSSSFYHYLKISFKKKFCFIHPIPSSKNQWRYTKQGDHPQQQRFYECQHIGEVAPLIYNTPEIAHMLRIPISWDTIDDLTKHTHLIALLHQIKKIPYAQQLILFGKMTPHSTPQY